MFVKQVVTNVKQAKGAAARTVALGQKTLIVGGNGTGKTGIVQGVELALCARAMHRNGVDVITKEVDLMALAPDRQGEVYATVTLSDGSTVDTRVQGSTASAHRPIRRGHESLKDLKWEDIFPARGAIAALDGSVDALRREIMAIIALDTTQKEIDGQIEGCPRPVGTQTPVDAVLAWRDALQAQAKAASARLKSLEAQAEAAAPAEAAQIEAQAGDRAQYQAEADAARAEIAAADERIAKIEGAIRTLAQKRDDDIRALGGESKPVPAVTTSVLALLDLTIKAAQKKEGRADCPACGEQNLPEDRFVVRAEKIRARIQAAEDARRAIREQTDAIAVAAKAKIDKANNMMSEAMAARGGAQGRLSTAQGAMSALDRVQERKAVDLREDIAKARREAKDAKAQAERVSDAIETVVLRAESALEARLRAAFGNDKDATDGGPSVQLRDGKREVCQVGVRRRGVLHTELSGAEWARMALAFAGVRKSASPVRIVALPDKALDVASLDRVLKAAEAILSSGAATQVIVQSVIEPSTLPEGWTVVRTAKGA